MDELDAQIEFRASIHAVHQEALAQADEANAAVARFIYEGRRYKSEWISKRDPRNESRKNPFKQPAELRAYWSQPELDEGTI